MKNLIFVLINSFGLVIELAVEKLGIVKYATTKNILLYGSRGTIGRVVLCQRLGKQIIRSRPTQFMIKDPEYWEGRFNRFRDCMKLSRTLNADLEALYQDEPKEMTCYNLLMSQLMKFWVGGPAPLCYVFAPGKVEVKIGNGSMPDAREVVFTPQGGEKLQIDWDTKCHFPLERPDDALQIMVIANDGKKGVWVPIISMAPKKIVVRRDGTYLLTVPEMYLNPATDMQVYCAIKFKTNAIRTKKVKGIFKFPVGITPITLIP